MLKEILEFYSDEEFLTADGFDSAVIGVDSSSLKLIYSVSKCLDILKKQGMEHEEAVEYFEFNVLGAYVGEKTPIWCFDTYLDDTYLSNEQINIVIDWLNEWEQIRDTSIPIRFKEDFKKKLKN